MKGIGGTSDLVCIAHGENGSIVLNLSIGSALDEGSHAIKIKAASYSWPDELRQFARLAGRAMSPLAVNEHKLGLRTEIDSDFVSGSKPAVLQRTRYFYDRTTNNVLDRDIVSPTGVRAPRGRDLFISDDERLIRLEDAAASNQLGGSTLLIDQSRTVYLTHQTSTSAESPGLLAPTGSGSFDLACYQRRAAKRPHLSFESFCRGEIERELFEETDLEFGELDLRTILIGFGRCLYRGGKPDMYAVSALRRTSVEMRVSPRERLWTGGHQQVALDTLLTWSDADLLNVSVPLAANVVALRTYLSSPSASRFWQFLDS